LQLLLLLDKLIEYGHAGRRLIAAVASKEKMNKKAMNDKDKPAGLTLRRCPWVDKSKPDYVDYHDHEWGVPLYDDQIIFEFLILEVAQAGLSWYTVLKKRDNYRAAFDHFDPQAVARYDEKKVAGLLANPGIIRNRSKIAAAVINAQRFIEVQDEFGTFAEYIWSFVNHVPKINSPRNLADYPATSPESDALSRDLKGRGFKFMGSTICYAHMQATGLVNDHALNCFRRAEIISTYGKKN
jgi:DNA-3-methyladenine glycosylase I